METSFETDPETNVLYASMGRRLLAAVLDVMVLFIPCAIAGHVVPLLGGIAVWFFYAPVLECSRRRATLGKYWAGIQVADLQGRPISFGASLGRNVLKLLSPVLLFLGCLLAFFTRRKQTLHDLIAETTVVYGRAEVDLSTAWLEAVRGIFRRGTGTTSETLELLERLDKLRRQGAITEEEFQAEKKRILTGATA